MSTPWQEPFDNGGWHPSVVHTVKAELVRVSVEGSALYQLEHDNDNQVQFHTPPEVFYSI